MVPVHPEQTGPGFTSTSPALGRSSRSCMSGLAASVVEKGGCAPPIAQAGCVGPDSRICVRRLHLLAGHDVKVPDRCLQCPMPASLAWVLQRPDSRSTNESPGLRLRRLRQHEWLHHPTLADNAVSTQLHLPLLNEHRSKQPSLLPLAPTDFDTLTAPFD